ncbi:MAG: SH3 domain-containing protein, partial [Limisphaerales bacterium]
MRLYQILSVLLFLAAARAAEESAIVDEGRINVRGKPSLIGEVVTQLERGEKVTVLERITNSTPRPGDPTNWAKIKFPNNTPVWVFAPFVKDGVVSVSRLNVRAGRG